RQVPLPRQDARRLRHRLLTNQTTQGGQVMAVKLETPHGFRERLLLFGGGGAGKTTTVLNIATHLHVGTMHVVDSDYSLAYERAIETEYAEVADRVQVHNAAP